MSLAWGVRWGLMYATALSAFVAYLVLFLVYGGGTAVFLPLWNKGNSHPVPLRGLLTLWALMCLLLAPVYVRLVRRHGKSTK